MTFYWININLNQVIRLLSILVLLLQSIIVSASDNSNRSYSIIQDLPPDKQAICAKVENLEFPEKDRPSEEAASALLNCDSEKLYFGIGIPADPEKARGCAFLEMQKEQDAFNGTSILMMIYANGKGAERNLDLALKLACNGAGAWAPAELTSRLDHLAKLKEENWHGNNFSVCDDITSGYMGGVCAAHDARIAASQRKRKFAKITNRWSNEEKNAFQALEIAANNFFKSRSSEEIDQRGTARAQFVINEFEKLENDFFSSLTVFEQGKALKFSDKDFKVADAKLNETYKKIMQSKKLNSMTTITPEGIKKTQRLWLKYRDAWVDFSRKKYPNLSAGSIKTWLTQKRNKMLEKLAKSVEEE